MKRQRLNPVFHYTSAPDTYAKQDAFWLGLAVETVRRVLSESAPVEARGIFHIKAADDDPGDA